MTTNQTLLKIAQNHLPAPFCRAAKRIGVYPRYALQLHRCRRGYAKYKKRYPQNILFVAGLPKSGTTWLENMLSEFPGFGPLMIPDAASFELATGGSENYNLPPDIFERCNNSLAVIKMHVHASSHNLRLLHNARLKYVTLYRDLRDIAVSYYYYVSRCPWHGEYHQYAHLTPHQGLKQFAARRLGQYADWVRRWHQNTDKNNLIIHYEQMLTNTSTTLTKIARHFQLDTRTGTINHIVAANSFARITGGRIPGQTDNNSFFRTGTSGNWKKYFTGELKNLYKESIGDFLIEFGYEKDKTW